MRVRLTRAGVLALLITAAGIGTPGSAKAGGAGGTSTTATAWFMDNVCPLINPASCSQVLNQLPTLNQLVVESAAIIGETPAQIRGPQNLDLPPQPVFDAGSFPGLSNPLAFIATPGRQPVPTNPSDPPAANSFLTATTSPAGGSPTTLDLTYDFLSRTNSTFTAGQTVGDLVLPFLVADINQNPVRDVTAMLQITGTGVGSGINSDIVGDFLGTGTQTYQLGTLGVTDSLNFNHGYLELDVGIPLLISSDIAPGYLFSASGYEFDPADGLFDGIDPIATFQDASFIDNSGDPWTVQADLAIALDGSTILSDPIPEPASFSLLGIAFVGMSLVWRRRRAG